MTRKTGKTAVKARQQMRAAKLARYKRELSEAGVKLSLPKPSAKARREKEEELKKMYLEMFPQKKTESEGEKTEQPVEEQPAEDSKQGGGTEGTTEESAGDEQQY